MYACITPNKWIRAQQRETEYEGKKSSSHIYIYIHVFVHFNLSGENIERYKRKIRNDSIRIIFAIRSFSEQIFPSSPKKGYSYPRPKTLCAPRYNERGGGEKERDVTSSRARVRQEGRGRGRSEAFGAVSSLATVASSNGGGCTSLQLGELDERYVYSSNGTRVVAGRVAGAQSRRSRRSANFPSVANKRHLRGFGYYESSSFLPSPRSRALPQGRTKSLRPPTKHTIWQLTTGLEAND